MKAMPVVHAATPHATAARRRLPEGLRLLLLQALNVALALALAACVVALIGESPGQALRILVHGAFGYGEGLAFTLYHATGFLFTGLAVALAFHAGLFNIGGEGQVYLGGLGIALVCQFGAPLLPAPLLLPLALLAAALFGAAWAAVPAWMQVRRNSPLVVTTIMFNFIAFSLMGYLITRVLLEPGSMNPTTAPFAAAAWLPPLHELLRPLGLELPRTPLNLALLLGLAAALAFQVVVWHTPWGLELRAVGESPRAAACAGIAVPRVVLAALLASGALAGLAAANELLGSAHRMNLLFPAGVGFMGIAVALMGRNHPLGIVMAALLLGALTQGGMDLSLQKPAIKTEMVMLMQGLIILVCGALPRLLAPLMDRLWPAGGAS